jgi:hypothetical protein
MMQLMALTALEPPSLFESEAGFSARREGHRSCARSGPSTWRAASGTWCSGQYRAGPWTARAVPGLPPGAGHPARVETPTFATIRAFYRQLALAGRALLPDLGQAPGPASSRAWWSSSRRSALAVPLGPGASASPHNAWSSSLPGPGHQPGLPGQGPGRPALPAHRALHFSFTTRGLGPGPDSYEKLLLDCMLGTRCSSCALAPWPWNCAGASSRPSSVMCETCGICRTRAALRGRVLGAGRRARTLHPGYLSELSP